MAVEERFSIQEQIAEWTRQKGAVVIQGTIQEEGEYYVVNRDPSSPGTLLKVRKIDVVEMTRSSSVQQTEKERKIYRVSLKRGVPVVSASIVPSDSLEPSSGSDRRTLSGNSIPDPIKFTYYTYTESHISRLPETLDVVYRRLPCTKAPASASESDDQVDPRLNGMLIGGVEDDERLYFVDEGRKREFRGDKSVRLDVLRRTFLDEPLIVTSFTLSDGTLIQDPVEYFETGRHMSLEFYILKHADSPQIWAVDALETSQPHEYGKRLIPEFSPSNRTQFDLAKVRVTQHQADLDRLAEGPELCVG